MKFFNLLKKEIAELVTMQTILSLVMVMVLLMGLGKVMSDSIEEATKSEYTVDIIDNDNTDFTNALLEQIESAEITVNKYNASGDYAEILKEIEKDAVVIIPEGFTDAVMNGEKPELISIEGMQSAAVLANVTDNTKTISVIASCIASTFSGKFGLVPEDVEIINNPVTVNQNTVVANKSSEISKTSIISKLSTNNMILPIIVFVLITMTSQTIMGAIGNEKIDKTLETLLSAPVSRMAILSAKMLAAAIIALAQAVVFMFGFSSMMDSTTDTISSMTEGLLQSTISVDDAMQELGLTLGAGDYFLVGVQLFFTIMICLSISIMLGALINDTKQSQTMILPLMFMAMVPYMVSMVTDINALPTVIKFVVYAIPFTHTFSAMSNIMFGNTALFFGGMAYQAVVFVVCLFFAVRLFKSDKILTTSLNFGQKSKFKKKASVTEE